MPANYSQQNLTNIRSRMLRQPAVIALTALLTIAACVSWTCNHARLALAGDGWTAAPSTSQTANRDEPVSKSHDAEILQAANRMFNWQAPARETRDAELPPIGPSPQQLSKKVRETSSNVWDLTSQTGAAWKFVEPAELSEDAATNDGVARADVDQTETNVEQPVVLSKTMTLRPSSRSPKRTTALATVTMPAPQPLTLITKPARQRQASASSFMTLSKPNLTPKRESAMANVDVDSPRALPKAAPSQSEADRDGPSIEQQPSSIITKAAPMMMLSRLPQQSKPQLTTAAPQHPRRVAKPELAKAEPSTPQVVKTTPKRQSSASVAAVPVTKTHEPTVRPAGMAREATDHLTWRAAEPKGTLVSEATPTTPPAPAPQPVEESVPSSSDDSIVVTETEFQPHLAIEEPYVDGFPMSCPPEVGYPCSRPACGVHCNGGCQCRELEWGDSWMIPWEVFAQGEYVGPSRLPHVPEYRLRVDDQIEFVYRLTGQKSAHLYRINIGDTLRIQSLTSENLNSEVLVQPDGTISVIHLGQVPASGRTIAELRDELEQGYRAQVRNPSITVTPIKLNTTLEELRATVDSRFGNGGQSRIAKVTPEGTVQLPAIGSVPAHGLTLAELGAEIEYRYSDLVDGLEVTPILAQRAPRFLYVLGEVRAPGRYTLEGPTTLMQAVSMAGGWNVGANLKQVVVFRRDENWQLMATKVDIKRPLYGKAPCPEGELWLRDSDIVVIPKHPILVVDEFIELVFTRGIYAVVPFSTNLSYFRDLSGVAGVVVP